MSRRILRKTVSVVMILMMVLSGTAMGFADTQPAASSGDKAAAQVAADKEAAEREAAEKAAEEKAAAEKEAAEKAAAEKEAAEKAAAEKEAAEKAAAEKAAQEKTGGKQDTQKEESPSPGKKTGTAREQDPLGESALSDGTYRVDGFSFEGGTGKAKLTCEKVILKDGKATAIFEASSENMTHVYMGTAPSQNETTALYDPATGKMGTDVYRILERTTYVPVALNETKPVAVRTTAMSEPHWIQYQYKITLSDESEKLSDDTTIPEEYATDGVPEEQGEEQEEPAEPQPGAQLADGTWKVKATTDRKMFYIVGDTDTNKGGDAILVKKGNKMTATFALTGEGYDYVYMGTPAQAKRAGKSKWIKAKIVNGCYTFTVPVSALDKKLAITPRSKRYEADGDPSTEPWRPDKWIIFYSAGAKKVKDGTTLNPTKKGKKDKKGDQKGNKGDKLSKWKDDRGKSTHAVNNKTSLKDGVYTPDRFSWSGGSGRLACIKCSKITVRGGRSYATLVFASSKYDFLKASGRIFTKSGGGESTFTIPIKLNANNTIIGRTTAMSMPHWIKYTIFVYKAGARDKRGGTATGDDGHLTNTGKLSDDAPDLLGLKVKKGGRVEKAEYFRIFRYEKGITLISVDQARDTALYEKEKTVNSADKNKSHADSAAGVEYDEEGKPVAKSQNQITQELYGNNVVNYLIVPKGVEIPAGLEKDCIIIHQPVKRTYVFSEALLKEMDKMGLKDKAVLTGDPEKPDYAAVVEKKVDLAIFPEDVLPEKVKDTKKSLFGGSDKRKEESEAKKEALITMQKRFAALDVPMIVMRSGDEKTNYGQAEWVKVLGAIYGEDALADKAFRKYMKTHKVKNLSKKDQKDGK